MNAAKLSFITALALGALVSIAPGARAQDNNTGSTPPKSSSQAKPHRQGQNQIDHLATQLKLTDDQKGKVQPILQDEGKKLRELRQDSTLNSKDRRAKVRELREQTNEKVQGILSKDQFEQFKKLREQGTARPPHGPAPAAPKESGATSTSPEKP